MLKNNKKSFKNVCKKTNAKLHWQSKSSKFSPDRLKSRLTPQNRMLEKFKHSKKYLDILNLDKPSMTFKKSIPYHLEKYKSN